MSIPATLTWRGVVNDLLSHGQHAAPTSAGGDFKGSTTKELLGYQSRWAMAWPSVACPVRKLGYRFMAAEAAWILSGDNRLATIAPYAKHMARFSDDGLFLSGAYGPPFVDQVGWVARTLMKDRQSRQAVATIWRPRPGPGNDTPCTVALQWIIRESRGRADDAPLLHCVATMRSSDIWHGVPYDVFNFSMMSAYVALAVKELQKAEARKRALVSKRVEEAFYHGKTLGLGDLILTAGSQHLYKADWNEASAVLSEGGADLFEQKPLDLARVASPQALIDGLWRIAQSPTPEEAADLLSHWGTL